MWPGELLQCDILLEGKFSFHLSPVCSEELFFTMPVAFWAFSANLRLKSKYGIWQPTVMIFYFFFIYIYMCVCVCVYFYFYLNE